MPHMTGMYGNPHSKSHAYGWEAAECVDVARAEIASLINCDPKEVVFTSGATESNNMSIKGVGRFYRPKKSHVITLVTEHKCVLDSCRQLEQEGMTVTYLPVQTNGLIDLAQLEAAITDQTALVSVMAVNNEIGVLQPIEEIGRLCKAKKVRAVPERQPLAHAPGGDLHPPPRLPNAEPRPRAHPRGHSCQVFFHCDAAQAIGKIPVDVNAWNVDLMSISGHKVYGPKGIGALYVRRRPRVRLDPIMSGGGQERGLRSGTLPHPLVAGLGAACAIAGAEMERDAAHIERLSHKLRDSLVSQIPNIQINGDIEQRYQGNLNVSFAYVEGESLIMALKDIAVSSGSACTSDSLEPSYVLRALGVEEDMAHTSIRFGIGRFTTEREVRAHPRERTARTATDRPIGARAARPLTTALVTCFIPARPPRARAGRPRNRDVRAARGPVAADEPAVGDGAGRRRPEQDPVVAALMDDRATCGVSCLEETRRSRAAARLATSHDGARIARVTGISLISLA